MSNALDRYEQMLVQAARRLGSQRLSAPATSRNGQTGNRWRRRPFLGRVRRLGLGLQVGLAVSSVSALVGGGTVAYLSLFSGGTAATLASFECEISQGHGETFSAGSDAITGDPIVDCAAAWPQATSGASTAPALAAWATTSGRELDAVVQPMSWGAPKPVHHWRRLPLGWTVNLGVVELTDQLNNISISPYGGPSCTYISVDVRAVRALLRSDSLTSWRVIASNNPTGPGSVSSACRFTIPTVASAQRTVLLLQNGAAPSPAVRPSAATQLAINESSAAARELRLLYRRVNRTLDRRCYSVGAAAALWIDQARAAGFGPATPAFYRVLATHWPVPPRGYFNHYTLYMQPASQHTGACAHVLVMVVPGSELANVYAARITP
ncbi:MAG: hypothetical protein ABSG64_11565 [Solirubrobacteraceae bacterium]|jgi:hypothetical protein